MMSKDSRSSSPHGEQKEPNYFSYYMREIRELFAQKEDFLSSLSPQNSIPSSSTKYGKVKADNLNIHHCKSTQTVNPSGSSSLFSNGVGDGLSDFKRERLKTSLKQSVTCLSREVDEMLEPVLAMYRMNTHLRERERVTNDKNAAHSNVTQSPSKKRKISSPSSTGISVRVGTLSSQSREEASVEKIDTEGPDAISSEESRFKGQKSSSSDCKVMETCPWKDDPKGSELDEEWLTLLDTGGSHLKQTVKKYFDEISAELAEMEQQLEDYLDIVMSKCRQMSLPEKKQLQKLIQKLPPKNLDRVVEIVQHKKPQEGRGNNEIHIDLEKEDNATLWRLYYYAEAVASAKVLAQK